LEALANAFLHTIEVPAGAEIAHDGDRSLTCTVLEHGVACRQKVLSSGKRQILSLHFAGDILDVQALFVGVLDHSIHAVTACRIAVASRSVVADLMRDHPPLAEAIWREAAIDLAIALEWAANLGGRRAYPRTAHLMCEIFLRMQSVGLVRGDEVEWHLSQNDMADALGLSPVHVNRTLQELRADGLITLTRKMLRIPDLDALRKAADFDPSYLHVPTQPASSPPSEPIRTVPAVLTNEDRHPDMLS
jgi:CRP-like cAMP-binding protein